MKLVRHRDRLTSPVFQRAIARLGFVPDLPCYIDYNNIAQRWVHTTHKGLRFEAAMSTPSRVHRSQTLSLAHRALEGMEP